MLAFESANKENLSWITDFVTMKKAIQIKPYTHLGEGEGGLTQKPTSFGIGIFLYRVN